MRRYSYPLDCGRDRAGRMRLMGARAEEAVGECFPGGLGGGP